jgi:hypothetical protein
MCVRLCVRRRFRILIDWRNRPGQSDSETGNRPGQSNSETGNRPGQSDSKNGNRSGLRTGGQTGQGGAGGRAGSGRGQGTAGRAGAPTGDFTVAFGHGHPLVVTNQQTLLHILTTSSLKIINKNNSYSSFMGHNICSTCPQVCLRIT